MTTTYAGQWGPEVLVDAAFHPLSSAALTLYEDDGVTLATRYLDRARTPAANPWTFLGPDNLTVFAEPNGYVLKVVSGATATLNIQVMVDPDEIALTSLIDAKGDLLAGTADNTLARLPVGVDGRVLTADAASTAGVKWAVASGGGGGGVPVGTIDLSASPYSVVANDVTAAAANTVAVTQALIDRVVSGGVKELVWPVGVTYVSNPVDIGGGNSSGSQTAFRFDTSGHDLLMRGAVGGYQCKIAFASDWVKTGIGGFGLKQYLFKTGAADNVWWHDLEFVGPSSMPTPFPGFQKIDSFYTMGVLQTANLTGLLHLERVKTSGYWTATFSNQSMTAGKVRLVDCDLSGIDVTFSAFTDDTGTQRKPGNRLDVENCDIRSHLFRAKSFVASATVTDSATKLDVVCDRAHNLAVLDVVRFGCTTANTAGKPTPFTGIAGMTGVTNAPYTVTDVVSASEFKVAATGVSGTGTDGIVEKVTGMEFAVSQVVVAGTTLTITTTNAMDLTATAGGGAESVFFPDGLPGVTGFPAADPIYGNGLDVVSVIDTHNFTVTKAGVTAGTYTPAANVGLMWKGNGLGFYTGVDLAVECKDTRFWHGNRCSIKMFSSSATRTVVEPLFNFVGCEFHGFHGYGAIDTCNIGNSRTIIADCLFAGTGNAVNFMGQAGSVLVSDNNEFYQGRAAVSLAFAGSSSGLRATIDGGHARTPANPLYGGVGSPVFDFAGSDVAQTVVMGGVTIEANGHNEYVALPNHAAATATLADLTLVGGASRGNIGAVRFGGELRMTGCRVTAGQNLVLQNLSNATKVDLDGNDFEMTSGTVISGTSVPAGKFRGRGNHFTTVAPSWSVSATGPLLCAPEGQNPTAATSAANTTLSTDYNVHHMTAVTITVNNLWVGGSAAANRCFGGTRLTLIFDGAGTTLSNSLGNVRLKGGADVTPAVGETRSFVFDATNDVWRET